MTDKWRLQGTTRSGRAVKPTFKVKMLIKQTVVASMRKLSEELEDTECQIRSAMRDRQPVSSVQKLYQQWILIQQEFEESESEFVKLVSDDELNHHRAMFKRKLTLQEQLVNDIEVYLRACKVIKLGAAPQVGGMIEDERARLEREIQEIETKLSMSHVSSEDPKSGPGHTPRYDTGLHHSTPQSYPQSYFGVPPRGLETVLNPLSQAPISSILPSAPTMVPSPSVPATTDDKDPLTRLVTLLEGNQRNKLPQIEPDVFSGDIMEFPDWLGAFEALVERKTTEAGDLLFYLSKYTRGEARQCISGMLHVRSIESYRRAKATLMSRFGNKFKVAEAYRRKLFNWPAIKKGDGGGLLTFTDYLWQCHASLSNIGHLDALNSPEEIVRVLRVVPGHIADRWDRFVDRWCFRGAPDYSTFEVMEERSYPPFLELCKFLSQEARVATGPGRILADNSDGARHRDGAKARSFDTEVEEATACATQAGNGSRPAVQPLCFKCKGDHWLPDCQEFVALDSDEKRSFAREMGLCFGCLRRSHIYRDCRNRIPDVLADGVKKPTAKVFRTQLETTDDDRHCSTVVMINLRHLTDADRVVTVYALLDSQSDSCFIKDSVLEELGADSAEVDLKLTTMGSCRQVRSRKVTGLQMKGVHEDVTVALPKCYSRAEIPADREAIARKEEVARWKHLEQVATDMPGYRDDIPVGLLVGFNCPAVFIPRGCAQDGDDKPFGMLTALGWCVIGSMGQKRDVEVADAIVHRTTVKEVRRVDFSRAFDLEFCTSPDDEQMESQNERKFRARVDESLHKTEDGHYEMDLPFKEDPVDIPCNREMAMRRLMQLKRRLVRDPEYAAKYSEFMAEMLSSGYAEEAPAESRDGGVLFSPHHGVEHPLKPGKIRPVFDAQAEYKGVSLNKLLLSGSEDPNNLTGVLANFRDERIGFMCDVKSMFYQVRVTEHHRDFLRYLWFRDGNPHGEIVEYRMKVHIFGAASSPSCANVAFRRNADDAVDDFDEQVIQFVKRQFYVDDGLNSRATYEEVVRLFLQSHELCKRGGFWLCKFTCNNEQAIAEVPDELLGKEVREWKASGQCFPVESSLGLVWGMQDDAFRFVVKEMVKQLTRRGLLSGLSSIYDPLGLISPVILVGRLILKELCAGNVTWDENIPEELATRWSRWYAQLSELAELRIPRCIRTATSGKDVQVTLNHFSDASTVGYGVCSYAVLRDADGGCDAALIYSKARVGPKKAVSMPRMELQAAVLAVKSAIFLEKELLYKQIKHQFWCDSKVVLGYVQNAERKFHLYVANRVAFIREHSEPSSWRYVRTDENPADLTSRGTNAADLIGNRLWWDGPAFIRVEVATSDEDDAVILEDDPEVKRSSATVHRTKSRERDAVMVMVERFSNWRRAMRVLARCLLFGRKLKMLASRGKNVSPSVDSVCLNMSVIEEMERMVLARMHREEFPDEYAVLTSYEDDSESGKSNRSRRRQLKEASGLFRLDVFLGPDQLLRVGGRLRRADLPYNVQHPVVLPRGHHITELLVRESHINNGHLGRGATLASLREEGYWVLAGRREVDRCTRKCVSCKRFKDRGGKQKMADLPVDRTEEAPPFTFTGVDVFGPYLIKDRRVERKRWVCMFTCLTIRAVQLEPLFSMSADSFMHAFRRVVNRRGPIQMIRCDCGTNFVGASSELRALFDEVETKKIAEDLMKERCDWTEFNFNVPKASHMGGVWERPIGTAKTILSSILHEYPGRLNNETFATFLTEAEGAMNCRPITCIDEGDPFSDPPLCPNHLLTLKRRTVSSLPGRFPPEDVYSRKEWRRVQALRQQFMSRWRREYLLALQKRQKWEAPTRCLQFGDVVLMIEDGVARDAWPMAVVTHLFASNDDLVRKVTVRSPSGTYDRPIHKLVYLLSPDDPLALPHDVIGEK